VVDILVLTSDILHYFILSLSEFMTCFTLCHGNVFNKLFIATISQFLDT
jgi:hypothetical protein